MSKFEPGKSANPAGRPVGAQNKSTKAIKDAFREAFERRGGADALLLWAESNETEFYRLASKLIPTEIQGQVAATLEVNWPLRKPPLEA